MSKRRVAPRSRSTKPATVVPIRPVPRRGDAVDRAVLDLEIEVERTNMYLRGARDLLDAWSVFERDGTPAPNTRDDALCFLGAAIVAMGEHLEGERLKLRMVRLASTKTRA